MTPKEIFEKEIPAKIEDDKERALAVNAIYQFKITGDEGGEWILDLTGEGEYVTEGSSDEAQCTVTMKDSDFVDVWNGDLAITAAFMMGKLKIGGDMSLAMKLTKIIS